MIDPESMNSLLSYSITGVIPTFFISINKKYEDKKYNIGFYDFIKSQLSRKVIDTSYTELLECRRALLELRTMRRSSMTDNSFDFRVKMTLIKPLMLQFQRYVALTGILYYLMSDIELSPTVQIDLPVEVFIDLEDLEELDDLKLYLLGDVQSFNKSDILNSTYKLVTKNYNHKELIEKLGSLQEDDLRVLNQYNKMFELAELNIMGGWYY